MHTFSETLLFVLVVYWKGENRMVLFRLSHLTAFIAVVDGLLFGACAVSLGVQHMPHSSRGLTEFAELGGWPCRAQCVWLREVLVLLAFLGGLAWVFFNIPEVFVLAYPGSCPRLFFWVSADSIFNVTWCQCIPGASGTSLLSLKKTNKECWTKFCLCHTGRVLLSPSANRACLQECDWAYKPPVTHWGRLALGWMHWVEYYSADSVTIFHVLTHRVVNCHLCVWPPHISKADWVWSVQFTWWWYFT